MDATTTIRLRLQFYKDIEENLEKVQRKFMDASQKTSDDYKIKVCENHIWFYIVEKKRYYWSTH